VGGYDWASFLAENASFEQKGKNLVDLDLFAGLPVAPAIFPAKIYEHLGARAMGYTDALAKDGAVIGYGAEGYKRARWEPAGGLPMTADARITLMSVSKTVTAVAFLTLGVSADDTFYSYFAQRFPNHGRGGDEVKIADLLTHKSGLTRVGESCGLEFSRGTQRRIRLRRRADTQLRREQHLAAPLHPRAQPAPQPSPRHDRDVEAKVPRTYHRVSAPQRQFSAVPSHRPGRPPLPS